MLRTSVERVVAAAALAALSPVIGTALILVWLQDRRSPFYIAARIGRNGQPFRMVKIRSMVVRADRTGVTSTSADDVRITPLGRWIRRVKLDELPQLWNVLCGEMAIVGPRPTVPLDVATFTASERGVLDMRPGLTDPSSIVFADEADILRGSGDPDLDYMRLIRPWKSRISLFYGERRTWLTDLRIVWLTALNALDRRAALEGTARLLARLGAAPELVAVAARRGALSISTPPGRADPITVEELDRVRLQHAQA